MRVTDFFALLAAGRTNLTIAEGRNELTTVVHDLVRCSIYRQDWRRLFFDAGCE